MIILDTNVVSEAMRPEPHPAVRTWLNNQSCETLYLSSVTLAELLFGIAALPAGKRKNMLAQTLDDLMGLFNDDDQPGMHHRMSMPSLLLCNSFALPT